jgi:hypothetical protein
MSPTKKIKFLQYYWDMNPAPPQPPAKNADRKAILAYHSELRRWADALARWEADLDRREQAYHGDDGSLMDDYDPGDIEECDCTVEEVDAGCDCPACERFRSERAQTMMKRQQEAVKVGDEIEFLENLWKLPDRRRKK